MTWSRLKQPCKCSHSKGMHPVKRVKSKDVTVCNYPGCGCPKYRPVKP
jgi:hypothetical protein